MAQTMTVRPAAAAQASPKISYEDFLVQYDGVRAEWVDGEVELKMSVSDDHQRIGNFLIRLISEFIESTDAGRLFQSEFQMKLVRERRGREPDLFFVAKSRLDRLQHNLFDGPGDLVIEIISPESVERDTVDKFEEYQSGGVPEYWLIDPPNRQVTSLQRDAHGLFQRVAPNPDGVYYSTGLPGFWVREEWFWQSPAPSMSAMRKALGLP